MYAKCATLMNVTNCASHDLVIVIKTIKLNSYLLIGIATGLLNVACNSLPLGQTTRATSTSRLARCRGSSLLEQSDVTHVRPIGHRLPRPSHVFLRAQRRHITSRALFEFVIAMPN